MALALAALLAVAAPLATIAPAGAATAHKTPGCVTGTEFFSIWNDGVGHSPKSVAKRFGTYGHFDDQYGNEMTRSYKVCHADRYASSTATVTFSRGHGWYSSDQTWDIYYKTNVDRQRGCVTPAEFRKVKAGVYYDDYSYGTGTPVGQIKTLLGTRGQQSHYAVYGFSDDDPWTWTYRMCGAQHAYNYDVSITFRSSTDGKWRAADKTWHRY